MGQDVGLGRIPQTAHLGVRVYFFFSFCVCVLYVRMCLWYVQVCVCVCVSVRVYVCVSLCMCVYLRLLFKQSSGCVNQRWRGRGVMAPALAGRACAGGNPERVEGDSWWSGRVWSRETWDQFRPHPLTGTAVVAEQETPSTCSPESTNRDTQT